MRGSTFHAGKGRKRQKISDFRRKALVKAAQAKAGMSTRVLARRFGISSSFVSKILQEEGIAYRKQQKTSYVSGKQKQAQKTRLKRLVRTVLRARAETNVVMGDVTYFTF